MAVKRIGVLTGGGDAPGLNPAIRALVWKAAEIGVEAVGIYDGWRGMMDGGDEPVALDVEKVRYWDLDGGTHLGSSRTNPFNHKIGGERVDASDQVLRNLERLKLDALVPIGGEDTLGVAAKLAQEGRARGRHPEDHRQGSRRHRLHARVRHVAAHLRRHHRALAHAGRLAPLGAGGRGHGPPRRTSRALVGARRRRVHHAHSRGAVRDRKGAQAARRAAVARQEGSAPAALRGRGRGRGRAAVGRRRGHRRAEGRRVRPRAAGRHRRLAVGADPRRRRRGTRARSRSDIRSAAARRRRSIASWATCSARPRSKRA